MTELSPPRGMRDIVWQEAELYEYLFSEFKNAAKKYGFEPIITPTVEHFALFEAKSGEEIKKSMYVFEDKAGRLLALRPEVTASVVRAYLKLMRARPKPIRLYYVAQCFRYEEPQYARYREFWQGGLEVIGDQDVNADTLVAVTASEFLDRVGVRHVYEVGNVALYRAFMKKMGVVEEMQDRVLHLIDKDRVDEAIKELQALVGEKGVEVFKRIISAEDPDKVKDLLQDYKELLSELYDVVMYEQSRLYNFITALKELGYTARYRPKLVRGLAYYTGLIFEYKVLGAEESPSIGGGGRYDGLTAVYGGPFEYATGLALGIDRIALALSGNPQYPKAKTVMVVVLGNVPLSAGYRVLKSITGYQGTRIKGFTYRPRSLTRGLEYGSRIGCDVVIVIGEKEYRDNVVLVKEMKTGEQKVVSTNEVLDAVLSILRSGDYSRPK
ncbi:MAG: histidine--tRNA ligase [Desulfurococcaceae archaeon]